MGSDQQLRESIKATIIDVLDLDDSTVLNEATTAEQVPGWDSLQHVRIMLALERKFHFRWDEEEIKALKNVGDLFEKVSGKISEKGS
jgi:acyl carrier protein